MKSLQVAIAMTAAVVGSLMAEVESTRVAEPLARLALDAVLEAPASLSADGRFVAFESRAGLVPADVNDNLDVYVLDRTTGRLTLESVAVDGGSANGSSSEPRLSADGRWLVFHSGATNLTPETAKSGLRVDVFVRDRLTGFTRGLTRPRPVGDATTAASGAVISGDGRVVAFSSGDPGLVPGVDANGQINDIYVLTLATGAIVRASVTSTGVQAEKGNSFAPRLNGDGTIVAFTSSADLEHGGAPLETPQVFIRDLAHGTTRLVSVAPDGRPANQTSHSASISGDGRLVAFASMASNLAPGDDNHLSDIYVRDVQTNTTTLVSHSHRGKAGNGYSSRPMLSADGQFLAFVSEASDLSCDRRRCATGEVDDNLLTDVYLADLRAGSIRRLSGAADHAWFTASQAPAIDAHGTTIVFPSKEPIDPRDVANDFDLFVWLRLPPASS
jgi:Tol biopolymer transport system component